MFSGYIYETYSKASGIKEQFRDFTVGYPKIKIEEGCDEIENRVKFCW